MIPSGKLKLEGDHDTHAKAARAQGWIIDEDDWWVRDIKPDDPQLRDKPVYGFTTKEMVFVRTAKQALAYDEGKVHE